MPPPIPRRVPPPPPPPPPPPRRPPPEKTKPKLRDYAERTRSEATQKRDKAARDMNQARADARDARTARATADRDRRRYERMVDRVGDQPTASQQRQLDRQAGIVTHSERAAQRAEDKANASRTAALQSANDALQAEWAANDAAKVAGLRQPFQEANRVTDAVDGASLDARTQQKLFGGPSVVSAQEAAQADIQRIQQIAAGNRPGTLGGAGPVDPFGLPAGPGEVGPGAAAEELERQFNGNTDPAYREALLNGSRGTIDQLSSQAGGPDSQRIVSSLSNIAADASPEQAERIEQSMARGAARVFNSGDPAAAHRLTESFKAITRDPNDAEAAQFTLNVANEADRAGDATTASTLDRVRPDLRSRAANNRGEGSAADSIRVRTVADDRRQADGDMRAADRYARNEIRSIERDIQDGEVPPRDIEREGDRVTVVRRNEDGEVTGRQSFTRDGDRVSLDTVQFGPGNKAQRETISTGPDGTTVRTASYDAARRGPPPTYEQLASDPTAQTSTTSYRREGENLVVSQRTTSKDVDVEATSTFSRQNDLEGINDEIEGEFVDGQPVDRVRTTTQITPKTDAGRESTGLDKPTEVETNSFSQGETRLTSKDITPDGEDTRPRQWTLELRRGNELRQEELVEGNDDYRRVTTRRADGNTVTETSRLQYKDEEGETQKANSEREITFADDGTVRRMHARETDVDGNVREQRYERTPTGNRRDFRETSTVSTRYADPAKPDESATQTSVVRPTAEGPQLVSARTDVQRGNNRASYEVNENGTTATFTGARGQPVTVRGRNDLRALPPEGRDLVTQARDGVAAQLVPYSPDARSGEAAPEGPGARPGARTREVSGYLAAGNNGLKLLKNAIVGTDRYGRIPGTEGQGADGGRLKAGDAYENLDLNARTRALAIDSKTNGFGAVTSALGLAGGAQNLLSSIQNGNALQIAADGASVTSSALGLVENGLGLAKVARGGVAPGQTLVNGALQNSPGRLGQLARFGGRYLGPAGAVLGLIPAGIDLKNAIASGDQGQIAGASVSAVGAVGLTVVAGFTLAGSAVPVVGNVAGAIIGTVVVGVGAGIRWLDDDEHELPDTTITEP